MRGGLIGGLPDLFFRARTWLAFALRDDTWTDFGGSAELIEALQRIRSRTRARSSLIRTQCHLESLANKELT
jgi:hypothetical protein